MGRKLEEEVGKSQKGPVAGPVPLWLTGAETRGAGVGPTPKSPAGAFTHRSYRPPNEARRGTGRFVLWHFWPVTPQIKRPSIATDADGTFASSWTQAHECGSARGWEMVGRVSAASAVTPSPPSCHLILSIPPPSCSISLGFQLSRNLDREEGDALDKVKPMRPSAVRHICGGPWGRGESGQPTPRSL